MCGINGIFAYGDAPPVDRVEVERVRDSMATRGPDGAAAWISRDGRVGLGHRRLAIIDLSAQGAQPMEGLAGRRITFNGEIYNYKGLRADLEARGYRFASHSDTEVLLHLYDAHGERMLSMLRGMFAFALWDEKRRGLWLVRDPLGIKPLYFLDDGAALRFASQVKALRAGEVRDGAPDPAGHVGFFLWGSVPEPRTLFRSIRAVPAGTALWFDSSGRRSALEYFDLGAEFAHAEARARSASRLVAPEMAIREELRGSVDRHMVSDVPVGVFLSSGLDSAAVAALASRAAATPLQTITVGCEEFKGGALDETPLAAAIAREYGTSHVERWFGKSDFVAELDAVFTAMDQPSIDGVNTFLVCREARRAGLKVALSGLGGDELLGGYPSFGEVPAAARMFGFLARSPALGRGLRRALSTIPETLMSPKYAGLVEFGSSVGEVYFLRRALFMPWELASVLDPELARQGWEDLGLQGDLRRDPAPRTPFLRVSALELSRYTRNQLLRDTDWASMANSVEVRVPFLDVDVLRVIAEAAAIQRPSRGKILSALHGQSLAETLGKRRKTGFAIPLREWGAEALGPEVKRSRGLKGWAREVYARFAP